jgi:hypothetical protein
MKRDIKFRVWDDISKAWHYWGNIQNNKFNDFDLEHYHLCQFTGLTDSLGKDIYEGDVYHQGDINIIYKVIFNNGCFIGNQIGNKSTAGLSHFLKNIVVIGNVHEFIN